MKKTCLPILLGKRFFRRKTKLGEATKFSGFIPSIVHRSAAIPFFEHDGLRLHYFKLGEGPPVLLIHGWGGRARRQWHKTIVDLRNSYHFYALSMRGHGHSEEVADPEYDWAALTDDCEALRQVVGVDRWMVVGYSLGRLVGLHYASRHPDRVVAVCAVSPMIVHLRR